MLDPVCGPGTAGAVAFRIGRCYRGVALCDATVAFGGLMAISLLPLFLATLAAPQPGPTLPPLVVLKQGADRIKDAGEPEFDADHNHSCS